MRTTIYLPDDLAQRVKEADINVSGVCQDALRKELIMLNTMTQAHRVELELEDRKVAFQGRQVAYQDYHDTTFYVTAKGRIVVYDPNRLTMHQYNDYDEFQADAEHFSQEAVSDVARACGEDFIEELDI